MRSQQKLFLSLEWVVPRHFCTCEGGQAGDGILQLPRRAGQHVPCRRNTLEEALKLHL